MNTPIKLNKDRLLSVVLDELIELLADQNGDWCVVFFWDFVTHQVSLDGTVENATDESVKAGLVELVALWLELLHGLAHLDHADGGALFLLEAKELEDSAVVGLVAVNVHEEDLASESLGGLGKVGEVAFKVAGRLGGKEEDVLLDVATEDLKKRKLAL